ncbi:MAG: DUF6049 family protein [Rhodoglobus sp.]
MKILSTVLAIALGLGGVLIGGNTSVVATEASGPVKLALAVPITVPESGDGLMSAETLERYTSPLGPLTTALDSLIGKPVALGIDPRIVVSIRVLGTAAPSSATAWLARLYGAPNETFPLSYADSDMTLATQAGYGTVLAPDSFDFAIDPALFTATADTAVATSSATPAPSPSSTIVPEPAVPTLPTSADLLAWPYSLTGLAWPRENTAIATDLPVIADSGYSTIILSSGNVSRNENIGSVAEIGGTRILISDDSVAEAFRAATQSRSLNDWQPANLALSAAIATAGSAQSGPTGAVFATLNRALVSNTNYLSQTVASMQSNPAISLTRVADILVTTPTIASIVDKPQPPERVKLMRDLLNAHAQETQFLGIAEDPLAITSKRRLELLAVTANGWDNNPDGWINSVAENLESSRILQSSVQIASADDFTFLAAAAPLPIAVRNDLNQAVTVYVTVRPDTGLLTMGESRVKLMVEANSQASAKIPAQAVSNGIVSITISLMSDSGVSIGSVSRARINVQAGWETPVVIVIAILVVGVFGGGLVRNIVRLRKESKGRTP